ncbi:MAG: aminotransferase class V-fold PLP-dependent enzyme [Ruminococcus sp.]|nr:aminotransferase class V-fold PLP-dependent enzyme [Ruminococcus sp.]
MIYLDNAATTYPKPQTVRRAVLDSFSYCANPGRAGHRLSIKASETVYNCRNKLCGLFNFDKPENVILTQSCTFALNTVIKGVLKKDDHVVISSLEHNSVLRPLEKLSQAGIISYSVAEVFEGDDDRTIDSFRKAMRDNTKLVVCTHASNVFGIKLPISRIGALCHYYGALFCVDAAQTAGIADIDLSSMPVDFLCIPGHKGLYGPMGTGALIINCDNSPDSLCEGGTGSSEAGFGQPQILPDKYESGTLNLMGIAGLSAGIDFVIQHKPQHILNQEMRLIRKLYTKLSENDSVILYTQIPDNRLYVPLLSFNIKGYDCEEASHLLDKHYGIAVRAGIHCSPLAHKYMNTDSVGTIRVCPSVSTTENEINTLIYAVNKLCRNKKVSI